jgi:hypothetical protein
MPIIVDPRSCPSWDDILLHTPGASFFHSSAWARVLAESYGYTPLYFVIQENGKFRALVPVMEVNSILTGKRGVSLPFTDYCEPIIGESTEFVDLFNRIIECGKKRGWKYLELRGGSSLFAPWASNLEPSPSPVAPRASNLQPQTSSLEPRTSNLDPVSNLVPVFRSFLGHTLDLTKGEERIFSGFRDSTRRNIKKAITHEVAVKICTDSGAVKEFYRLNCLTRREHGLPPQPYHFFQNVYEYIISRDLGFVTLASCNGQNIAGAVFFHLGDRAVYKYGASDKRSQELRANNLVMWEGIKWSIARGFKSFCFGRTEMENEGLRQFKSGWGPQEYQIQYFKYNLHKEAFVRNEKNEEHGTSNGLMKRLFQRLPVPALNAIGSLVYRHIG